MSHLRKYLLLYFFLILLFQKSSTAKSDTLKTVSDTSITRPGNTSEFLLEGTLDDSEDSKLLDYLEDLESRPFDLNSVTLEELEEIPYISSNLAREIIKYRDGNFPLKSKRELLSISDITEQLYETIKIYLVVKKSDINATQDEEEKIFSEENGLKPRLIKDFGFRYRSRFQQDLQTKEGYLNGNYPGSKAKIYNQLNFTFAKDKYLLTGNITLEKDAGESSLTDFSSGYIELKNYKFIRNAVAGDYSLTFGQGLGMWSGLGFSKGSISVDPVKKRSGNIRGYSSANESQFFRGAAVDMVYKRMDFFLFYSNNYFDASIDTLLDEISSFYFDGYHRTISERSREKSAREQLFGGRIYYGKENIRLGLTYWTSKFSKQIGADSSRRLYNFTGDRAGMLSADYDFIYRNMNLYGEFARSQSGSIAEIGALRFSIGKTVSLVFLYRGYPEDFSPVHSFGFGEKNGNTQNETGFYSGVAIAPMRGLEINAYFDQFKFPYRSYSDQTAVSGNDFLTSINWSANKNLSINFRAKNENKEDSRTVKDEYGRDVKKTDNRNQMNLRITLEYGFTKNFKIKSRYDYVLVKYSLFGGNNRGSLFYTDLRFFPLMGLAVSTRFIFFDTESYDSRVYEYEDDIRGVMSNIGLYGKGRRWYVLIKYKIRGFAELYGKYSETYIDGAGSIGTGNDLIKGDINNKLNLGVEINF